MLKNISIFPLPAQLLPDGKLQLRIFEPRYLRMVKECSYQQSGFGVTMAQPDESNSYATLLPIGTIARIIDFEQLDGGVLGITVLGCQRFQITQVATQADGLMNATITELTAWPDIPLPQNETYIASRLCEMYEQYPEIGNLYNNRKLNNLTWLCQRWLEILPLDLAQKQHLMAHTSCEKTHLLLTKLLQGQPQS